MIHVVGVIGAGVMGIGVSQSLAQAGFLVKLIDISEDALNKAREEIYNNVRMQAFFDKSITADTPEKVLDRIEFSTDLQLLKDADFVIENATEKWEVKKEIYPVIDEICPQHCVFAVNTSCISITRIGSLTKRADRILGMHFMNPVPLKPMVEAIRGHYTSEETIQTAKQLLGAMEKECIVVNDMPGFVSNRVLMLTINEAIFLIQDQVASAEEVDTLFKTCFGHKSGPLETGDLIGLDTILYSIEALYEAYNDSKYRPCPLLKKMVSAGYLGRKSGKGFYEYQVS